MGTIEGPTSVYAIFAAAVAQWADRPFLHVPGDALDSEEPFDMSFAQAGHVVAELRATYAAAGPAHREALVEADRWLEAHAIELD